MPSLYKACLWLSILSSTTLAFMPTGARRSPAFGVRASSTEEDIELTIDAILQRDETAATGISVSFDDVRKESYVPAPARPGNDRMIKAAFGEPVDATPTWLFRQAGRHLPEYQKYKADTDRNFLELLADPESVAECTLQPLRRYEVDAAILFSDILVIAEALGIEVTMPGGVGIQVPNPLTGPEQVAERIASVEEITPAFVEDKLSHVLTSVRTIREKMAAEGKDIPLIGFSAAPWTLLFYMVGGSSKKNKEIGVQWLTEHPQESTTLLEVLTKVVTEYLSAQVEAGAHMLQIFEAMGMMIDEKNFDAYAMPCLEIIGKELKSRYPDVPLMVFSRGASYANAKLAKLGYYDVITIDGSVDRATAREVIGSNVSLQGNYDPAFLIEQEDGSHTPESVRQTVREMLEALGPDRLIANLGEGLGGRESPELVKAFVNAVHEESASLMDAASSTTAESVKEE